MKRKILYYFSGIFLFLVLFLFACDGEISETSQVISPTTLPASPLPEVTSTNENVETVESSTAISELGILFAPPDSDQNLKQDLQSMLSEWAQDDGLQFNMRDTLSAEDFEKEDIRWVVALDPAPNLLDLAVNAPETTFLAVGVSGLAAADNLSIISLDNTDWSKHGFIAGYMAAMITPDWRIGVIGLIENQDAESARLGFMDGVTYFCGLCRSEYPPYYEYPLFVEIPEESSDSEWRDAADLLLKRDVETIYLVPGVDNESLLQYLVDSEIKLIGDITGKPEFFNDYWVGSLRFDFLQAVQEYRQTIQSEKEGIQLSAPLVLEDPNPNFLSPGRQILVRKVIEEILVGYIATQ